MYKALYLSPVIPSHNLQQTGKFFKEIINFSTVMDTAQYAIYRRDNLTVHLLPAGKDIGQLEFYLEVDNVDGIWESIKEKVKHLKVREPFDREYGMREIHIGIPQTERFLFMGQEITKQGEI